MVSKFQNAGSRRREEAEALEKAEPSAPFTRRLRIWNRFARKFGRRVAWALLSLGLVSLFGWLALPFVPLPQTLFVDQASRTQFLDRDGRPLRIVRPGDNPYVEPIQYADIPRPLIEATLAAEDHGFWKHHGVDGCATLRALWQCVRFRRVVSGGSTITQQLIKLAEPRPRTLRTKFIEAAQAMRLEQVWDKQRILTEYFNRLDYGNLNRGAAAAAEFYFAKPLSDLSPAECALLAALPQAPSRLNPHTHFDRAQRRQQWILSRMHKAGALSDADLRRALNEPVQLAAPRRVFEAPHFVDLLLATHAELRTGPIQTTLDLDLNRFAEETLRRHLSNLQAQHVSSGAVVILDNQSGDVLALVGSEDYFSPTAGQVNSAWARRSPGSTIKPFTYWLALERGATPASIVADVPTEFATATGLFAPVNYDRHCYGPMRYRLALANSLNISAVKVLASVGGPEPLQRLLQQCGLSTLNRTPEQYGLGLTIGNAEARLLELANAYACLARLGEYKPYQLLASPRDGSRPEHGHRIADATAAYLIADILSDNNARTLAFGAESSLRFDFPVACKTGTSSDFRDNWAFGYTPEFTIGVWTGNPDGSPMRHVSGVSGAAPILHELFEHLHQLHTTTWYSQPPGVIECWIDPITGKRLRDSESPAANALKEKFAARNLPPWEDSTDYQTLSGIKRVVRLGREYRDWFVSSDNWIGEGAVLAETADSLRIVFPPPGTTLYLDADLRGAGRRLHLRASGPEHLEWHSDSLILAHEGNREIAQLSEGHHAITVRDPVSGAEARTWIEVRAR
jgi:penicillin-binding protein 1C